MCSVELEAILPNNLRFYHHKSVWIGLGHTLLILHNQFDLFIAEDTIQVQS